MGEYLTIFNWNVRGLNAPARSEAVRTMIQAACPNLVCLEETKLASVDDHIALDILGYSLDGYHFLPASGTRGGILVGWNTSCIEAVNPVHRDFSLLMEIRLGWISSTFNLIIVYAPTDAAAKSLFLEELVSLKPHPAVPWLVLGDFNLIYEASDKNNLNLNRWLIGKFKAAMNDCELFEFALQNRKFTWSNEQEDPTLIRLDRVFYNSGWDLLHSGFRLQALYSSISDHCPLVLCQEANPKICKAFCFENFWLRIPGYTKVVKDAW
jgi:exonuclease III